MKRSQTNRSFHSGTIEAFDQIIFNGFCNNLIKKGWDDEETTAMIVKFIIKQKDPNGKNKAFLRILGQANKQIENYRLTKDIFELGVGNGQK